MSQIIDVSRPSIFGNPYRIGTIGPDGKRMTTAGSTLAFYENWLLGRLKDREFEHRAWDLYLKMRGGAKLYCRGCFFDSPTCHARILEKVLHTHFQEVRNKERNTSQMFP